MRAFATWRFLRLFLTFSCFFIPLLNTIAGPDSLRALLAKHRQEDGKRLALLLHLANAYDLSNADSVMKFSTDAYTLSKKLNRHDGLANAWEMMGAAYVMRGSYDTAGDYFNRAIAYSKETGNDSILSSKYNHLGNLFFIRSKYADARIYYDSALNTAHKSGNEEIEAKANGNIANIYYKMGNYTLALQHYLAALSIQEKLQLEEAMASELSNIANVYYRLKKYQAAKSYNDKAIAIARKHNAKQSIVGNLTTYALIYNDRKLYDSSLVYLHQALDIAREMRSEFSESIIKGNVAEALLKKGDFESAGNMYNEVLSLSQKLGDAEGMAIATAGLGEVDLHNGNKQKGYARLEKALTMMQQLGIREQALDISAKLSAGYERDGNYRKALQMLKMHDALADSIEIQAARQKSEQLIFNYEISKKEDQIMLLEQQKQIADAGNQTKKILIGAFIIALAGISVIAWLLYRSNQMAARTNTLITGQKNQIEEQKDKLAELNDFKDVTLSLLAHDLRSPVNSLASTLMMLDENMITPEEFLGYKHELNSRLQAVNLLLDNMLFWAQEQMKKGAVLETEKVNLRRKALAAISVLSDAATQKNISILNKASAESWAYCDKDHISIAVRNILANAIKFTRGGGEINISTGVEGNRAYLKIADNGVGMTREQLDQLFSLNHASTAGTTGERGTGLGLSLCYTLIKKNHGDIVVESERGKGSEFKIMLPLG